MVEIASDLPGRKGKWIKKGSKNGSTKTAQKRGMEKKGIHDKDQKK